jgi:hypothetical protein
MKRKEEQCKYKAKANFSIFPSNYRHNNEENKNREKK